eukprot:c10272_g1_i1.p1 GENE.c10272_g1_i1~~c10272_g1_i1.p1  ORF type:complete len:498 (-),score=103.19 c10272_g1_i1:32-1315(-)
MLIVKLQTTVADADEPAFWSATSITLNATTISVVDSSLIEVDTAFQTANLPPGGRIISMSIPSLSDIESVIMIELSSTSQPCRPWILDRITATLVSATSNISMQFDSGYIGNWLCLATSERPIKLKRYHIPSPQDLRFAYIVHGQNNPRTFERTFQSIYHPSDLFCVNINPLASKHTRDTFVQVLHTIAGHPLPENVLVTEMRTDVGDISAVDSVLLMMRMLLDMETHQTQAHWQFLTILSDSHLPLKSRDQIIAYLSRKPHRNFIATLPSRNASRVHWPIEGMNIQTGSEWSVLSHGFVTDLIEHLGTAVTGKVMESQFRTVDAPLRPYRLIKLLMTNIPTPIEHFFLTSLIHGPYAETWVDDDLRYTSHSIFLNNTIGVVQAIADPSELFALDILDDQTDSKEVVTLIADEVLKSQRENNVLKSK